MTTPNKPITLARLLAKKRKQEKITCLTAYDASFGRILTECGVDMLLIGDSLGMVMQGHDSTVPVTLNHIIYHAQMVRRGAPGAWLIADMPFMTTTTVESTLATAKALLQEAGVQMVKLEGGQAVLPMVRALVEQGVPVCGHLGLLPQHALRSGYQRAGKTPEDAARLLDEAVALESAGASLIVLECVLPDVAQVISQRLTIPTIGIGSGAGTDGQVLVLHDILGLSSYAPSFAPQFLIEGRSIKEAVLAYVEAVKTGVFPSAHCDIG
ncbi:MAG: 3-methyl-2-oxobutanoate hydroxymethyltransferase [Thiotrichales bacterium]|jgi:3-methyl-2-oxobutanoate hydroxymethyltransferase|nr:3-methyl-2-oxobutanoate hydroxymethyltransferase [Thiotrichales bacterium]